MEAGAPGSGLATSGIGINRRQRFKAMWMSEAGLALRIDLAGIFVVS
jgi:hypothetical protein